LADAIHRRRPIDLIHAHFIFPDGVIAANLGRRYGVPVLTTEHAVWLPWLDDSPSVRAQVERALPGIDLVTGVSERLRSQIAGIVGSRAETAVLPNVVEDDIFTPGETGHRYDPNQLVFVGAVRRVKGLDVLVKALSLLVDERPRLRLLVVGEPYFRGYRRDELMVRDMINQLGLTDRVTFAGRATPAEVAAALRDSALLVMPSRRETFGAVALEALATGTPVVATRCGGPEETLDESVAHFAPPEDAPALARAIAEALEARPTRDPERLRHHAVSRYGRSAIASKIRDIYGQLLDAPKGATTRPISFPGSTFRV
jgi:glycosyltransferase involved in cell wall biosynthesis